MEFFSFKFLPESWNAKVLKQSQMHQEFSSTVFRISMSEFCSEDSAMHNWLQLLVPIYVSFLPFRMYLCALTKQQSHYNCTDLVISSLGIFSVLLICNKACVHQ